MPLSPSRLAPVLGVVGVLLSGSACAATISDSLGNFVNRSMGLFAQNLSFPNIAGEFIEREALGSLELPVPATSTSVTFSFDPEHPELLGAKRTPGSLGPVFVDRADTLGQGRFDLLFSYQFAHLTDLDGASFGRQLEFAFGARVGSATLGGVFLGKDLALNESVFSFNGTYGVTPRWDVNLLVPLLYTTLDLDGVSGGFVDNFQQIQPAAFHDEAFGIGDILLRTKYRFFDDPDRVKLAGALTLRLPSGNPGNFQGLGDFTIAPTLIASRAFGRHDLHVNLGMEFNTMDGERSRARYAIGVTLQPRGWLAILLDVLGSSGLDAEHFSVPTGNVTPSCDPVRCIHYSATPTSVNGVVPRSDIVDLSAGIKLHPTSSAYLYLAAIVPLTQQGFRAAVIPAGGFEWTF